nr:non-histone chromosomal protein HMG-14 isoform X1 [Mirounga angustirostris]
MPMLPEVPAPLRYQKIQESSKNHCLLRPIFLQWQELWWINLQTEKCKQRGKGEQRENRLKWLTKKRKKTYLQKTEKLKMRRVQPPMKQERKKPSLINTINHVLSVVPVALLVQSRGIFLSTIL